MSLTNLKLTNLWVGIILICCSFYAYSDNTYKEPAKRHDNATTIVIADFNAILEPDVLHGFLLGSAPEKRGYVTEVTPLDTSNVGEGASVQTYVEPEFNGSASTWYDVVRVKLINTNAAINANIRVYALLPDVPKVPKVPNNN